MGLFWGPTVGGTRYNVSMNKNRNTVPAKFLTVGQDFIFNFAGGNQTVYTATRVSVGGPLTQITYVVTGTKYTGQFHCPALSTLHLV